MGEIKHVFGQFYYYECDAFAEYLTQMSAEGWKFRGWGLGMEFEKASPARVTYTVEVFDKSRDNEIYPMEDSQEFSEYCQAVGWEFVDGFRKFMVFRCTKEDAVPIRSEEEHFSNVKSQVIRQLLGTVASNVLIVLLWSVNLAGSGFLNWVVSQEMIAMILMMFIIAIVSILNLVDAEIKIRKVRKIQAETGQVFFGKKRSWDGCQTRWMVPGFMNLRRIVAAASIMILFASCYGLRKWPLMIMLGVLILVSTLYYVYRPKRRWVSTAEIIGCIILVVGIGYGTAFFDAEVHDLRQADTYRDYQLKEKEAPINLEDLEIPYKMITDVSKDQSYSYLAQVITSEIWYDAPEDESQVGGSLDLLNMTDEEVKKAYHESQESADSDVISIKVYYSRYSWIRKHIWNATKDVYLDDQTEEDVNDLWKADRTIALVHEDGYQIIEAEKKDFIIVVRKSGDSLTREQIEEIYRTIGV